MPPLRTATWRPRSFASNPNAAAFAANYVGAIADQLGVVDPGAFSISGISTDGDNLPVSLCLNLSFLCVYSG